MQQSFLNPKLVRLERFQGPTKKLSHFGYTREATQWAVKRAIDGDHREVIAEWLGHSLFRLAGLPVPDFSVVECPDGELAFGTRWETTAVTPGPDRVTQTLQLMEEHASAISAALGGDATVLNPDRHLANFIFVQRPGQEICLAIDFGLGWPARDLPPGSTLPPACNTAKTKAVMVQQAWHAGPAEQLAADTIRRLNFELVSEALDHVPDEWLQGITRPDLMKWWKSHAGQT